MRRVRPTTRSPSCCRSAIRAGRSSIACRSEGNDTAIRWPGTRLTNPDRNAPERDGRFDFSFSGLKTAVLRHVRQRQAELGVEQLPHQEIVDLAASFQRRVVDTLIDRAFAAARWHGAKSIGIAGGVSANSRLRSDALAKAERSEIPVYIPRLSLSTDNAAMIAAAGLRKLAAGRIARCRPQRRSFAAALTRNHGNTEARKTILTQICSTVSYFVTFIHPHSLVALAVELAVEDLLPRTEVELALGDRDDDFAAHDLALHVRVGVVFAGAVVRVALRRRVERRQLSSHFA